MQAHIKKGYLCALGAVLIWSGFILVSRKGGISPLLSYDLIAIRYFTCATLVLPFWLFWKRFNVFKPRFILSALVGGFAYAVFAFTGFKLAPASHAAVLLPGLLPLVIIVASVVLNKERHPLSKWLGIGIITSGIALLFWLEYRQHGSLSLGHLSLAAAAACWGAFSVLINRWNIKPWEATVSLSLVTCAVYAPIYLTFLPKKISLELWQEVALQSVYQGFLATIVQMMLYVRAVQLIGAAQMGSMMAIVPILAGFTAIPLFNEPLKLELVLALLLVSFGVWLTHSKTFQAFVAHRALKAFNSSDHKEQTCPTSISKSPTKVSAHHRKNS